MRTDDTRIRVSTSRRTEAGQRELFYISHHDLHGRTSELTLADTWFYVLIRTSVQRELASLLSYFSFLADGRYKKLLEDIGQFDTFFSLTSSSGMSVLSISSDRRSLTI